VEENLIRKASGIFDIISGTGAHEIIIDTPNHDLQFTNYSVFEFKNLFQAFKIRTIDLKKDTRLRYILPFKNYGKNAGATLTHPHSQIIALPEIPDKIKNLLRKAKEHYENKERCLFCDILNQEISDNERIINENDNFVAFCPFASTIPFEIKIFPKFHSHDYSLIDNKQLNDFVNITENIVKKLKKIENNISVNMFIQTIPYNLDKTSEKYSNMENYYHWHCVILPRITPVGGFEFATGINVNMVMPEEAADFLRNITI
jgi:UDPglucose--hexose-1-phosphate uridylyltransferase